MLPIVVCEESIRLFKFYHDDRIKQGMSYSSKLYILLQVFGVQGRLLAYESGCRLANQGNEVVVTASPLHYKIWVEVRSIINLQGLLISDNNERPAGPSVASPSVASSEQVAECVC